MKNSIIALWLIFPLILMMLVGIGGIMYANNVPQPIKWLAVTQCVNNNFRYNLSVNTTQHIYNTTGDGLHSQVAYCVSQNNFAGIPKGNFIIFSFLLIITAIIGIIGIMLAT
jgi:hypothetical protein